MTGMLVQPELMATAAADIAGLGATLGNVNAAAAEWITGVSATAADEISEATEQTRLTSPAH
jgi:hypothetical protein